MVEVRWKLNRNDGTPESGYVLFTPRAEVVNGSTSYTRATIRADLNTTGLMSVDLLPWDAPGNSNAVRWTYLVEPKLTSGRRGQPFDIDVPYSATADGIDLADVAPVTPGSGDPTAFVTLAAFNELATNAVRLDSDAKSMTLHSSSDGGGNTFDSTGRLNVSTYQRATRPNHFGEAVRIDLKADDAKGMIAWREDYTGNGPRSVAWIGAHGKSNDGLSWHNHISVEVPDETGALQTALEIPFAPWDVPNGFGIAAAQVYVRAVCRLIVDSWPLSIEGPAGTFREVNFGTTDSTNQGGKDAARRWSLRATNVAETGANAGTDFQIVRRDDAGNAVDSPVSVVRSTGNVGIGTQTPTAKFDVNSNSIRVRTARTPATATATGNPGDICWDAGFVYVCVATNTWKRAALTTWP